MGEAVKKILSSMKGAFLPYQVGGTLIPGGRVRIDDLSYYGVLNDKKNLRTDIGRVSGDFRKAADEAKGECRTEKRR